MFSNTTHVVYQFFVDVPGVIIGGWVGVGLFGLAFLFTLIMIFVDSGFMKAHSDSYELVGYCITMILTYVLASTKQFVFMRDSKAHEPVNLLMVLLNTVVWVWVVIRSGNRMQEKPNVATQQNALGVALFSQLMIVLSLGVGNGTMYALWSVSVVLEGIAIVHYALRVVTKWNTASAYGKAWVWFAIAYTLAYMLCAFFSHLYLQLLSMSAAICIYLSLHLCGFAWLFFTSSVDASGRVGLNIIDVADNAP